MEHLFSFLMNASIGIVLFYLVYWLFLRKETFFTANRWFLLAALFTSVLLPLFPVHYSVMVEPGNNTTVFHALSDAFRNATTVQPETSNTNSATNWQQMVLVIYLTGSAIFLLRLLIQTLILIHLMLKYRVKPMNGIRVVENEKYGLPFSFFNIVFINPKFHTQDDLPEILAHEKVHIREFHWFDLLFIELLTVIFWFNPFIWFFERSIKQNHEYLADEGVLAQGHGVGRYQAILLNQLMGMQIIGLTNNLNFALNTNRLKMMTKKKTSRKLGIKFVWALPAIALLLFAFAEPVYKVKAVETESTISAVQSGEKEFTIHGKVVREGNEKPMHGASVIIKGTTIGTVADKDGTFTLVDPNPRVDEQTGVLSTPLVISYVGMETIEARVSASGKAIEDGRFTFKMKEGVVYIDTNPPLPPPPPSKTKMDKQVPPPPPPPVIIEGEGEVFFVVEDMPKYPGGHWALVSYVVGMQKEMSKTNNLNGKVQVGFTVDQNGKVSNIKVLETDNDEAAKSAVDIVSGMPDWSPGKQRGKAVPVNYIIPIEFN